jgi:adenylate kinase family enzyme
VNVHIIGPAGSGKTTLARWIAEHSGGISYDLDWIVYDRTGERPLTEVQDRVGTIVASHNWVTEGAYRDAWITPLLEAADCVIWLDFPWWVCLWRIFKRHLAAELRRDNQHKGWLNLLRFMRYTQRVDARNRRETEALLRDCRAKVVVRCSTVASVQRFKAEWGAAGVIQSPP